MSISRSHAAELARETLAILETGQYRTESGFVVSVGDLVSQARAGTESYPPDHQIPEITPGIKSTWITVDNMTTLAAAAGLIAAGYHPAALNFASAKNPGGEFLRGARAQEESLCRSSGLYPCILDHPMYEFHRAQRNIMYSDYAIYSPGVPVIRDDDGQLLERSFCCAFITAPAVNAGVALERDASRRDEIRSVMAARISKVLAIAAVKEHDALVLGAWGCGVFGNDSQEIAELFRNALTGAYRGIFSRVVFAVIDRSPDQPTLDVFQRVFQELIASPR